MDEFKLIQRKPAICIDFETELFFIIINIFLHFLVNI